MKFFVWKKRFIALIVNIVVLDALFIALIIFFAVQRINLEIIAILSMLIVVLNIVSIPMLRYEGSVISFEENIIKCMFLKKVRQIITYNEIEDYGVFCCGTMFQGGDRFIYISRFKLSENQKGVEAYRLYRKTKDVLVLQYHDEVFSLIKSKCPGISPQNT